MSLLQKLYDGSIDIVGDIHGEIDALKKLIKNLGYDESGNHKEGRKLIFVGDLVDRGPDSPSVVFFIKKLIENGNAQMVLGNHEINLLQHKAKHGSGWYFESQEKKDHEYVPFKTTTEKERKEIFQFLEKMPIALENDSYRVVHAAWVESEIEKIKNISNKSIVNAYLEIEKNIDNEISSSGLLNNYHLEESEWRDEIEDKHSDIPFLNYVSKYNLAHQMNNPIRVLTSGIEKKAEKQFFASGKWRFVQRDNWWDYYEDKKPVIVGHFWRELNPKKQKKTENVFEGINPNEWHGLNKNVFCVDYSVGARFIERKKRESFDETHLAALRLPENKLYLDNGEVLDIESIKQKKLTI